MDSSGDLGSVLGVPELTLPQAAGPAAGPLGLDPRIVWAVGGEASGDAPGRLTVASLIATRAKLAGVDPASIVTEPGQFESLDPDHLPVNQKRFPVGSPQYQALEAQIAPIITGAQPPIASYTGFRTHGAASGWNGKAPITTVGGNDFATVPYKYSGVTSPGTDLGHVLGAPELSAAPGTQTAQTGQPETQSQAEAAFKAAFGTVAAPTTGGGDAANAVPGGFTISPNKAGAYVDAQGQPYAPAPDLGNGYFRNKAGQAFQVASPPTEGATKMALAPAGTAVPPFPAGQSAFDRFGIGLDQGVRTIGTTADKFQNWLDQNVPGANWVDTHLSPLLGAPTGQQAVAMDIANRDANDIRYGSSPAYGLGKFGGEVGTTLPLMAMTGGAAEAAPVIGEGLAALRGGGLFARGVQGALQGAEAAGITSGGSEQPLSSQLFGGAVGGGVIGGLAPVAAGALGRVGALANRTGAVFANALAPLTESGRGQIADNVIRRFAAGGPTDVNAAELVPGSVPTLAQATANPGLAAVERAVRDVRPNQFIERSASNANARIQALSQIAGTPETVDELEAARNQTALPLLRSALETGSPADATPVVSTIDDILASPAGQRDAVKSALTGIRSKLVQNIDAGGKAPVAQVEDDPAQLYGIRQAIGDSLSPLAARTGSNAQLASRELLQVRDALDGAIEDAAPGYKDYLTTYARMSGPANAQSYLQGLNLTDAQGNITLAKAKGALDAIARKQALPGVNGAKSVSPEQVGALQSIYDDLQRESNSSLGKSIGSNTFQNLATNNLLANAGAPAMAGAAMLAHHPLLAPLAYGGRLIYNAQNGPILDALTSRLLNPELGGAALQSPPVVSRLMSPRLQGIAGALNDNAVPIGVLGSRLFQPQAASR